MSQQHSLTAIIIHLFSSFGKLVERAIYICFRNFIYRYIVCKVIREIVNSIGLVDYPQTYKVFARCPAGALESVGWLHQQKMSALRIA